MDKFTTHVDNQGRMSIPSWWRKAQEVTADTELCVAVTAQGALVVETRAQGLRRAQAILSRYIPEGVSLSDELIADRREEVRRGR